MKPLDRKLLRDLSRLRGQVLTIALVVGVGIASYVGLGATFRGLEYSRDTYYERQRFADVWSRLRRAPESVRPRLEAVPGVQRVYTRLVENVMIPMPGMPEPALGEVVSIEPGIDGGRPPMNGLLVRAGRGIEPGRGDEVVVLEAFAQEHGLSPGDTLPIVLNGKLRQLRVVGIGMSPEYVFGVAPGDLFGDKKRFGVLWMDRAVVAAAFRMEGAFDSVVAELQPGASAPAVLAAFDALLEPWGGSGAYARARQQSAHMLDGELAQLRGMATTIPVIFLLVAAFLLNVVLARLVQLQRTEIAALKALGYRDLEIGAHYLKLVLLIVAIGAAVGLGLGAWLARGMLNLYAPFFRFPSLSLRMDADLIFNALLVSVGSGLLGGMGTVRWIMRLPPAEAMRPPAPLRYAPSLLERIGLGALVGTSGRMVLREVTRRPLRTILSSLGIAMAVAILVSGRANMDAIDYFMDVQFGQAQRQDLTVTFARPMPERAARSLEHLEGVTGIETTRALPVRFRNGPLHRDSALVGHGEPMRLERLIDRLGRLVALPPEGLLLERKLAEILRAGEGDTIEVEVLDGEHRTRRMRIAGLIDQSVGLLGHARIDEVARLLGEERLFNTAQLAIDPARAPGVLRALKDMPAVLGVARQEAAIEQFREQSGDSMATMTIILTLFAATIAIGVVYNNARVALSQRARDLASLRVLGFTRGEVSSVLLGEMAIEVLLALPPGMLLGKLFFMAVAASVDPETFRLTVVILPRTYAFAAVVVLASALVSALIVRRRVDALDLIAVLKTRE